MDEEAAEEFFDNLEAPLKETFKIPKRKISEESNGSVLSSPLHKNDAGPKMGYGAKRVKSNPGKYNRGYTQGPYKKINIEKSKTSETQAREGNTWIFASCWVQDFYDGKLPQKVFEGCSETHCSLCKTQISSEIMARNHYAGKQHLHMVDRLLSTIYLNPSLSANEIPRRKSQAKILTSEFERSKYCEICRLELPSSIVAITHYQGQRHARALKKSQEFEEQRQKEIPHKTTPVERTPDKHSLNDLIDGFYCRVCKVDLLGPLPLKDHLSGKPHLSKLKHYRGEEDNKKNPLYCDVCCLMVTCQASFEAHCKGKKHIKRLIATQNINKDTVG